MQAGPEPGAKAEGRSEAEDGKVAAILLRAAKARQRRRKIAATLPLQGRAACRSIAL
jgi:hypothetical protein